MKLSIALSSLFVVTLCSAQPESRSGQRGGEPEQMVDRIMRIDANGDGRLSFNEMEDSPFARLFRELDTNNDGFLDREEVMAFVQERRGGQGAEAGGDQSPVEARMRRMQRTVRALDGSDLDDESQAGDLVAVQALQATLVDLKAIIADVPMSDAARERFADEGEYRQAIRLQLLGALEHAVAIERAVLLGDGESAREHVDALMEARDENHAIFQPGDGDDSDVAVAKINLNIATEDELNTIPGMTPRMVHEFEEYRPYISITQFRREIGKYVDADQVAAYEKFVFVPIDPNRCDAATLMQIPGVDDLAAQTLIRDRPFADSEAFLASLEEWQRAVARSYLAD